MTMQNIGMRLCAVAMLATACAHEVTNEERLDQATESVGIKGAVTAEELAKVRCDDTPTRVLKARGDGRAEGERLAAYLELYESLKKRVGMFDEAVSRNPDLIYREGMQDLNARREVCQQQEGNIRVEFERYTRDLVAVPTVPEVKGGKDFAVPRVEFGLLRKAVESLNPEDKEVLLATVSANERKTEVRVGATAPAKESAPAPTPKKRK